MGSDELGWVAAVLTPRLVAPHPNFFSKEMITPYGALALLTANRYSDFARLQLDEPGSDEHEVLINYGTLYKALRKSATVGSVLSGAHELAQIANEGLQVEAGLAFRSSCAVLAAVAFAESDALPQSEEVLRTIMQQIPKSADGVHALLRGWLLCALSQNAWDSGRISTDADDAVREAEAFLGGSADADFNMSLGTSLTSLECSEELGRLVRWSARHQVARARNDWGARLEMVREATPRTAVLASSHLSQTLNKQIEGRFDYLTQSKRGTHTFGGASTEESALVETLLWHEYLGSPGADSYRSQLGMHRFETGVLENEVWRIDEGLRLLRAARDHKRLKSAANVLLRRGPLASLQKAADTVAKAVLKQRRVTPTDLAILIPASSLLDDDTCDALAGTLLENRNRQPYERGWAGAHPRLMRDDIWRAIRSLATSLTTEATALEALLDEIVALDSDTEDYSYARLLEGWTDDVWREETLAEKVAEARSAFVSAGRGQLLEALGRAWPFIPFEVTGTMSLEAAATIVDRALRGHEPIPPESATALAMTISRNLSATREHAANGQFSGGGISAADVAVAYAVLTSDASLWEEVVDFVLDPNVQRDDKASALQRMARSAEKVPAPARSRLRQGASELIAGGPGFFDDVSGAFGPGVRLLSVLEQLVGEAPIELIGGLMAEGTPEATEEAATALLALMKLDGNAEWLASSAMWLTYHHQPETRSIAGQALACCTSLWNQNGRASRLQSLLEEDGVYVPVRVLLGLQESAIPPTASLIPVIESLGATHTSSVVRRAAIAALESARRD